MGTVGFCDIAMLVHGHCSFILLYVKLHHNIYKTHLFKLKQSCLDIRGMIEFLWGMNDYGTGWLHLTN